VDDLRQAVTSAMKGAALTELNTLLESYNLDACGGPINVLARQPESVPDEPSLQDEDCMKQCTARSQAENV